MTIEAPKSATDMTADEWRSARAVAASGKLPTPAQAFKIRLNAEIAAAEAARAAPPPSQNTSNTSSPTPTPKVGTTGVMDMTSKEYGAARSAIIAKADSDHKQRLAHDNRNVYSIPPIGEHKAGF